MIPSIIPIRRFAAISMAAVALAFALPAFAPVPAQAKNCKLLGKVKAPEGGKPITIKFVNKSGQFRHIDWIDFDGRPEQRASLNPGQVHVQQTTAGSAWMSSNGPGDCVDIFRPKKSKTIKLR